MTGSLKFPKLSWGWRIALLYSIFVVLIVILVVRSSQQHFDLVSGDYYQKEITYQQVLDAGKNQSALSSAILVHADASNVVMELPGEFSGKAATGDVHFYSPVNAEWDKTFKISTQGNNIVIPRSGLQNTRYTIKISCTVDGKPYYQESEIILH